MTLVPVTATLEPDQVTDEPLSLADYQALKQALAGGRHGHRNILIVQCLFGTGLRIAELLRLTRDRVTPDGPDTHIQVWRGKRQKKRWETIPLHPELGAALRAYIQGNGIPWTGCVFAVTARQVQRFVRAAGIKALGRPVHPHQLRKLYATTLIHNDIPVAVAAKMLGHSDSRTTEQWYHDLTLDQRHEINRRLPI